MSYADKSRTRDFDQHASKIKLGLEELRDDDAKRAIWELFQNAVDLSDKCHIKVEKNEKGFLFEHNGKPFMDDSLASLIKQVTNKPSGTQEGSTGQYGTGFITTHIYGKCIQINGYAEAENGYVELIDFLIDRKEEENKSLSDKIKDQDNLAGHIIDEATDIISELPTSCSTRFQYLADTKQNHTNGETAIDYAKIVLPLVFVFNDRLSAVDVHLKEENLFFKREKVEKKDDYWVVDVSIDGVNKFFVCLFSDDEKHSIRIVLPYDENFQPRNDFEKYPKLFLFYPLIGTEKNGFNCIIHANSFSPQEKRDSLYLEFINDLVKPKVTANQTALDKAFTILLSFLEKNPKLISNTLPLCKISLNHELLQKDIDDFWETKKSDFIDEIINIPLIETHDGRKSFLESYFFSDELLRDEEYKEAIYSIAIQFFKNIPFKEDIIEWSKLTASWCRMEIKFLTVEDILKKIKELSHISSIEDKVLFRSFLNYAVINAKQVLFEENAVLPNIYGDFIKSPLLKNPQAIDESLIRISEKLFPTVPQGFISKDFLIEITFNTYSREDFKKEINEKAQELTDKIEKGESISFDEIEGLIDFVSINKTTEINKSIAEHLSTYFNYTIEDVFVDNSVKDFDYRSALKTLFRYFISDITTKGKEWLEDNLQKLTDALKIVYLNDDFKKTVLHELKAYPNQNYVLVNREGLKLDKGIPKDLKDIYQEILDVDYKDLLALLGTEVFLQGIPEIEPQVLGNKLEDHFRSKHNYSPINDHPQKEQILKILQFITVKDSKWGEWFPILNSQKLEILVGKITAPNVQKSMFAILTKSDAMISALGEAAQLPNLTQIIEAGKKAIEDQSQHASSFQHKYLLGKRIEDIIRNRISHLVGIEIERPKPTTEEGTSNLLAKDEQDGQDIVIYLNKRPIYYIEVKSRWNPTTPFRISRNQTIQAFDNPDKYALISIDMTRSTSEDPRNVKTIEEIASVVAVNDNVGEMLSKSLIDSYKESREENAFHIDGDFRTYVPLKYIESGMSLSKFEDVLIEKIQSSYA